MSCLKIEVDVLGCPSLTVPMVSVDVKQRNAELEPHPFCPPDNRVSWEEYRGARGLVREPGARGRRMSELEEMVTKLEFRMADQNSDDCLDWWEFLNLASQHVLGKRSEVSGA